MSFAVLYMLLIAPAVGSFLAVVVERWPRGESPLAGRSHCRACGARLHWHDMIPIVSALWLGFRCRQCGARFSAFSLWIELGALAVAVAVWLAVPPALLPVSLLLGWVLLLLALLDARHYWLPDALTLPLVAGGLLVTWQARPAALAVHLAAAAGAYAALWALNAVYRRLRGRDGLGMGDAKLMAGVGAWCGPLALSPVLLIASSSALLLVLGERLRGTAASRQQMIPFGVYISAAFLVWWLGFQNSALAY